MRTVDIAQANFNVGNRCQRTPWHTLDRPDRTSPHQQDWLDTPCVAPNQAKTRWSPNGLFVLTEWRRRPDSNRVSLPWRPRAEDGDGAAVAEDDERLASSRSGALTGPMPEVRAADEHFPCR